MKLILMLPLLAVAGCKLIGNDPSPPGKMEQALFNVVTNYQTNTVFQTNIAANVVTSEVFHTNEIGQVVTTTNTVTNYQTNTAWVTNVVPSYVMTPNDTAKTIAQTGGGLANVAAPGMGSMVSSGLLALLAIWGHLRSAKNKDVAVNLAQEVEAVREFIKTLPSGNNYDSAITQFLQTHQVEAGVIQQVLSIVDRSVSNPEAKAAAAEMSGVVQALKPT